MIIEGSIYNKSDAVKELNKVEGFNPLEFMRTIEEEGNKPKWYLDVKYRILWFRLRNPNGKIATTVTQMTDKNAIVEAKIYLNYTDEIEKYISKATSQKNLNDSQSFLEWAETAAIGRALTNAGYGIQFCDLLEGNDAQPTESGVDIQILNKEAPQNTTVEKSPQVQAPKTSTSQINSPDSIPKSFEEAMQILSLEESRNIKVDFGKHSGKSIGAIAISDPSDIEWIAKKYAGRNFLAKAAANILLNNALKAAS